MTPETASDLLFYWWRGQDSRWRPLGWFGRCPTSTDQVGKTWNALCCRGEIALDDHHRVRSSWNMCRSFVATTEADETAPPLALFGKRERAAASNLSDHAMIVKMVVGVVDQDREQRSPPQLVEIHGRSYS